VTFTPRSRGLAEVSEQTTVEQVGERRSEPANQTEERGQPDLSLAARVLVPIPHRLSGGAERLCLG
jgi:hypothetical protein